MDSPVQARNGFEPSKHAPENSRPVDFTFSSFGDPYSDPRMNLPDLFVAPRADMSADVAAAVDEIGTIDERYLGTTFRDVLGPARARSDRCCSR